jgi:hypothetical protein
MLRLVGGSILEGVIFRFNGIISDASIHCYRFSFSIRAARPRAA